MALSTAGIIAPMNRASRDRSTGRSALRFALALGVSVLLSACAAPAPSPRDSGPENPVALAEDGRYAEAAEAWLAAAERDPEQAASARLRAAEAWLAAGESARAVEIADSLRPAGLIRTDRFRLDLLRAELALERGAFDRAERFVSLAPENVPAELRDRWSRLRDRLAAVDPEAPEARLEALRDAVAEPGFEPSLALALLIEVPLDAIDGLIDTAGEEPGVGRWLELGRTARAHLLDPPALKDAIEDWADRYPDAGVDPGRLAEWLDAWRLDRPMPKRVAILLPGEAPLSAAGEALRDGMLAAWMELPESRRPELDFHYLGSGPDEAVGAWFEAREAGADFVIGPLDRAQIPALLAQPDPGVPMLLLNRPTDDAIWPTPSRPLAMLALPPEEEAELAAIRALVDEHSRALIIAQDTEFGERLAGRFAETFELGGGRIADRIDYPPNQADVTDRLEDALRLTASQNRIARVAELLDAPFQSEPQRRTDIDVVFLAARDEARQVQPQLKFVELASVPILATSNVLTPGRDRDLDGLRLPLSPWLLSGGVEADARRAAEQVFPAIARSITLTQLHALGRDAIALLPWMEAMKRDPRLALAGNIGALRLADGIAFERDLPWAVVRDGLPQRP